MPGKPARRELLLERLSPYLPIPEPGHRIGVAYSGGVDSTSLVVSLVTLLGQQNVLAFFVNSQVQATSDCDRAVALADELGFDLVELDFDIFAVEGFRQNPIDRCYLCKSAMFLNVVDEPFRRGHRISAVVYGENADDALRPDRLGAQAALDCGIRAPFAEAGFTKADVRELAEALGLPIAQAPASPCLATRVPFGTTLTDPLLRRIEDAERFTRTVLGVDDLRVRVHRGIARIELPVEFFSSLLNEGAREAIVSHLNGLGFHHVVLDLGGLVSGSFARHHREQESGRWIR